MWRFIQAEIFFAYKIIVFFLFFVDFSSNASEKLVQEFQLVGSAGERNLTYSRFFCCMTTSSFRSFVPGGAAAPSSKMTA